MTVIKLALGSKALKSQES